VWPPPLLTYVGHGGEQFAGLAWVDYNAPVHDLGDLRGFPAQPVERVRWQLLKLDGVPDHVGEDGPLPRDCGRAGGPAILRYRDRIEDCTGMLWLADFADRK
jgi:hypothetical protein